VIDDSLSALQVTGMNLAEAGYEARTCSDRKRALEFLESEPFVLIITDIHMPDLDGLEVIRAKHRIGPNIPIVAVSGMTGPRNMLKVAQHLGAYQTVQKPFSKANLLAAVGAALSAGRPGHGASSGSLPGSRLPARSVGMSSEPKTKSSPM
jgi:DNA-binding NtrC family response regulator